ncbi:MAG: hypothetical protein QME64_12065 [bacterium]|nr:hypothetical protein [bacterium]
MKRLGQFYREKVLSLPKKERVKRDEFELDGDQFRIEKQFFNWVLYSGKNPIDCRSEEEARYLQVFLDAGMQEIYVPKDDEYLKSILPELERLKTRTDEIINRYTSGILDRRIRSQIRYEVFLEITQ